MRAALGYMGRASTKVKTIFVFEHDPNLEFVCRGIEDLAEAGSLHPEPVVIAVPAHGAQASERRHESDVSDEEEESLFSRRATSLQKRLVRERCNRHRD